MRVGKFLLAFGLVGMSSINAFAQRTLTLREAIDSAVANNFTVLQAELLAERAASSYKQTRFNRYPSVNGSFFYGGSRGRSIDPFTNAFVDQAFNNSSTSLNSNLPVFAGGQIHNSIEQYKALYEAGQLDLEQAKANLTMNVIAAYLLVLASEDQYSLSLQQLGVSEEQVKRLRIVDSEGAIAPYLLTDLQGEFAMNRANAVLARNNVQQSKISLQRLINMPYDSTIKLSRDGMQALQETYTASAEQVYTEAKNFMALIRAAEARSRAADYGIKAAKGQLWPTFSLSAGVGTNYSSAARRFNLVNEFFAPTESYVIVNGTQTPVVAKQQDLRSVPFSFSDQYNNNLNAQFGLSVQIPILNNYIVRNRINQARIDKRSAEALVENNSNLLQQDVWQAWQNMQSAYDRYIAFTEQANALAESFKAAQARFENGVINSPEYLLVKNNYDRAMTNLTQAQYEFIMRSRILDFYRGKL